MGSKNILWFNRISLTDIGKVGGKNASLGEMLQNLAKAGVKIPNGFATTAEAYRIFLKQKDLQKNINHLLAGLDVNDLATLEKLGKQIRDQILTLPFLPDFIRDVETAYLELIKNNPTALVAVRSSATAEDLPNASFAGQQETFLQNQTFDEVLISLRKVFASLYNDRAIIYRINNHFPHEKVLLSAGIQLMVRSDVGSSGVAFSLDTESGFSDVILINAAYGLGEPIVQGSVNPDEYYLYKPNLLNNHFAILSKKLGEKAIKMIAQEIVTTSEDERRHFALNDDDIHQLGNYVLAIEKYYKRPMDVEWAKDGIDGQIYIVQARPETVKSRDQKHTLKRYVLKKKSNIIIQGRSIGQQIGQGKARVLNSPKEIDKVINGDILVTDMTDPDWEPIMKKAAAIITNRGGRTCHAAIVARELGIPAIVGCGSATTAIIDGTNVTASCAEGETGYVYDGLLPYECESLKIDKMPPIPTKIMLNLANPEQAYELSFLPNHGVGLARLEFIINDMIGIHPNAVLNFAKLSNELQNKIQAKIYGYGSPIDFYISKLREGIATIAAAFYPKPVIVRMSDFKTNEYANLLGGEAYEPKEENPMIGFRGASRYVHDNFRDCFILECRALKEVRERLNLTNVEIMIPFVRTVKEIQDVLSVLAENGLERGANGLRVIMMCEIPSNVILAEEFLKHVDGFSIGSNDLTQLTLGLDRDSNIVAHLFDERDAAVKFLLARAISACRQLNKYIGICGQAPSDYPDLAKWLVEQKIGSLSLNADSLLKTWLYLA